MLSFKWVLNAHNLALSWAGGVPGARHTEAPLHFDIYGVGVCGVVSMAAGCVGGVPSPNHVTLLCCLLQGPQVGQGLRIGLLVALGECHGAEVRVLRCGGCGAWGAWCQWPRGAWIVVPSPHRVLLLCCLLQGPQVGQELRIGLLVALGECHGAEVRVSG